MENELRGLRKLSIHTFLFPWETEVMRCIRRTGKAYQAKVKSIKSRQYENAEARQEALSAHGPPSMWIMLEVLELMVGDTSNELVRQLEAKLGVMK